MNWSIKWKWTAARPTKINHAATRPRPDLEYYCRDLNGWPRPWMGLGVVEGFLTLGSSGLTFGNGIVTLLSEIIKAGPKSNSEPQRAGSRPASRGSDLSAPGGSAGRALARQYEDNSGGAIARPSSELSTPGRAAGASLARKNELGSNSSGGAGEGGSQWQFSPSGSWRVDCGGNDDVILKFDRDRVWSTRVATGFSLPGTFRYDSASRLLTSEHENVGTLGIRYSLTYPASTRPSAVFGGRLPLAETSRESKAPALFDLRLTIRLDVSEMAGVNGTAVCPIR